MDFSFITDVITNSEETVLFERLKDRYDYWNRDNRIKGFYNNLPHREVSDFATEKFDDGFIVVTESSISYDNLETGDCHVLEQRWNDVKHGLFVQLSTNSKTVRTERVGERKVVSISGRDWMYTKYVAPNGEYGDSIMLSPMDTEGLIAGITNFIDNAANLINEVKTVSEYSAPARMLNPSNWYKDSVGFFMANLYDWSSDLETEKATGLVLVKMHLDACVAASRLTAEQANDLLSYTRLKWK